MKVSSTRILAFFDTAYFYSTGIHVDEALNHPGERFRWANSLSFVWKEGRIMLKKECGFKNIRIRVDVA